MNIILKKIIFTSLLLSFSASSLALTSMRIPMTLVNEKGTGVSIGTVEAIESVYGVVLVPNLQGLKPGLHGFHVHQNASCLAKNKNNSMVAGLAAGGHYDPHNKNFHSGPQGKGHLGDLPTLYVDDNGRATMPILAPNIMKISEIQGRALMVHAKSDNYSDLPSKLGGGGPRAACGVINLMASNGYGYENSQVKSSY